MQPADWSLLQFFLIGREKEGVGVPKEEEVEGEEDEE